MWLLPAMSFVSSSAAKIYYRLSVTGEPVPSAGPVLLVANHPNSLIDPMMVAAGAGRPVRFLAKAPLFEAAQSGWLVRAAGAIPIYRRSDDPSRAEQNADMFRAVFGELAAGSAVGIFPEGRSHSDPSLSQLKTGAARIALGTAERIGGAFPIVPVGLVFRRKDVFRSKAHIIRGRPVAWDDIATKGVEDRDAVRTLTLRISEAMRRLTVNLDRWEDQPLVECAEAIWSAEFEEDRGPAAKIRRLEVTTAILGELRQEQMDWGEAESGAAEQNETGSGAHEPLPDHAQHPWRIIREVRGFRRRLDRLDLSPAHLDADVGLGASARWTWRRLYLLGPPVLVLGIVGLILFWPPYQATAILLRILKLPSDQQSTYKLLCGMGIYAIWLVLLVVVAGLRGGIWLAAAILVGAPVVGFVGLWVRERWKGSWSDVRRFFVLRSRRDLIARLREQRGDLANQLKSLYDSRAAQA